MSRGCTKTEQQDGGAKKLKKEAVYSVHSSIRAPKAPSFRKFLTQIALTSGNHVNKQPLETQIYICAPQNQADFIINLTVRNYDRMMFVGWALL